MNDLPYPPYEKIAETTTQWRLGPEGFRALNKVEWVVTEKIHGANFCLATNGTDVKAASRREWVNPGDAFFGWESVYADLSDRVRALFASAAGCHKNAQAIFVYGEIFGGGYPHPLAPPVSGVQPVQTGVWYAPDIRFAAFDLRMRMGQDLRYLDFEEASSLLHETGIQMAPVLFTGRYQAALDFPLGFDSHVPAQLGLPRLPDGTNPAEGVVMKPVREMAVRDTSGTFVRPVLKRKIPRFAEDRRFHEAEAWTARSGSGEFEMAQWEAYCRITRNRLDAAVSKLGERAWNERPDLQALLVGEILDEARAAVPSAWSALSAERLSALRRFVEDEVRALIDCARRERS